MFLETYKNMWSLKISCFSLCNFVPSKATYAVWKINGWEYVNAQQCCYLYIINNVEILLEA